MFDLNAALRYPYSDKKWASKLGVYFLIAFIVAFIGYLINGLSSIGDAIRENASNLNADAQMITSMFALIPYFIQLGVSILLIPINIYLGGYVVETLDRVKDGNDELPEHKNIGHKMKLGLVQMVLGFGPGFLSLILILISIIPIVVGIISLTQNVIFLGVIMLVIGIPLFILAMLASIVISTIVIPSMLFIYLETNSVGRAYSLSLVSSVAKKAGLKFLAVYGISYIAQFIGFFVSLATCCISWITMPLFQTYVTFVTAHLTGSIFLELKKEFKLKD